MKTLLIEFIFYAIGGITYEKFEVMGEIFHLLYISASCSPEYSKLNSHKSGLNGFTLNAVVFSNNTRVDKNMVESCRSKMKDSIYILELFLIER